MKIKGWKNVFAFTFVQQIKTKSFIIGTIVIMLIMALITALANIIPALVLGDQLSGIGSSGSGALSVQKLYISNSTGYDFDFSALSESLGVSQELITPEAAKAKATEFENSSENAMLSEITLEEETGFVISSCYAANSELIKADDCAGINSALSNYVRVQYLSLSGVPEDKIPLAMASVSVSLIKAGEEQVGFIRGILNSIVPMLSSIVLFVFIFSYSQLVAQSVAIEKSSRIMEYLLTSIKPLAIIMGKVLAMCTVSLLQFICIFLGGVLGFTVSMPFGIFSKVGEITQAVQSADTGLEAQSIINEIIDVFSSIDPLSIVVMIVTFILGFLFFSLMAGLAGASVSKMEDLASALQPISIIGVLGFYLAYFPQITAIDGDNMMMIVARYVPISSPFIITSDYMLGKIGIPETCISIVLLIAVDIGMAMLVAKVYEHIVLHTGNRLKLGDMLKMADNKK